MAAAQVDEPGAAVLVALGAVVVRDVIGRFTLDRVLDHVRDLLRELDTREHRDEQEQHQEPRRHTYTTTHDASGVNARPVALR